MQPHRREIVSADRRAALVSLTFATLIACGVSWAQQARTGAPTPSPEGAGVYFVGLADGAQLPTKVTIRFGLRVATVTQLGEPRTTTVCDERALS
jgi:hypothetical protein